jgi:hypothetical protein
METALPLMLGRALSCWQAESRFLESRAVRITFEQPARRKAEAQ